MKYQLEMNVQGVASPVIFNTITLDSFKVNIVERYSDLKEKNSKLCEVYFKLRTLEDQIIKKKDGTTNMYIRGDNFRQYMIFRKVLSSPYYKKRLINTKLAEQDLVHFIISLAVLNYDLN